MSRLRFSVVCPAAVLAGGLALVAQAGAQNQPEADRADETVVEMGKRREQDADRDRRYYRGSHFRFAHGKGPDVSALAGKTNRLRFVIEDAEIHSFPFQNWNSFELLRTFP